MAQPPQASNSTAPAPAESSVLRHLKAAGSPCAGQSGDGKGGAGSAHESESKDEVAGDDGESFGSAGSYKSNPSFKRMEQGGVKDSQSGEWLGSLTA